jgi:exopolyphosphatase / guanosine-5'-triphosphate,3'-diphosphate pyrophosphatase
VRVAVVDLGSNSFRVVVADIGAGQEMTRHFTRGEHLHLAASAALQGAIPRERVEVAVGVATELVGLAQVWECDLVRVTATSVFREAANGAEVLDQIGQAIGLPIEMVDDQDEAALALNGALWGFGAREPLLVADLGGGSLELATGRPESPPDWLGSLPLGVSRLAAIHAPAERLRSDHRIHLDAHVAASVAPLRPLVDRFRERRLVVVGGTARALGHLLGTWRHGSNPPSVHGLTFTAGDLARVIDRLGRLDVEARRRVPGVKPRRARLLPVGACIIRQTMRSLGLSTGVVGETGMREGLLLQTWADAAVAEVA